jgi:radical SAM superfamily enzyme YgiQ (UPF0313 family)
MIDVLFTHSYFLKFDPKEHKAMMPYAPLGTLYAASYIRTKGYSTALFDAMLAESERGIESLIKEFQPKYVVIYDDDFNYLTKMCLSRMREAAFSMSHIAKELGCIVIVHGSDAADHIGDYINHGANYVIFGEGEITLSELLNALSHSLPIGDISGLAYQQGDGIQRNGEREVFHQLDSLPLPAWDMADIEMYRAIWKKRHGYFSMNMVTTRGCPFHCNWCAKPIYGQVYNSRTPENVVEEMKKIKSDYHPDHLWFCDDIFGLKPGWVSRFSELIRKENAMIPFKCLARADLLLKENTIQHLAEAGCATVWVGAESGSQKILDAMEKGTTIEQIYTSTRLLHERGIHVGFFLQYGYPGETREDIELTLRMVKDCKPDEIGISVSYPLPGTKFYDSVKQQLGEKKNWTDSQDLDLMFQGSFVPDFYRTLHTVTHKKFRIWQGQDTFKSFASNPIRINKQIIRRMAAMAYHSITLPTLESELNRLATIPRNSF